MFVNTKPRKRNAPRPAWKVCVAYLQWLRGRQCALVGNECSGPIEAAHTPDPASKGMGTKAADKNAIPLCSHHHATHTAKGWSAIGLTRDKAQAMAAAYWRQWRGDKGELADA